MKKLFIISNESIFENEDKYFCDNIDLKSTPEGLNENFEVNLIARKSKKHRSHEINLKNVNLCRSIFSFIKEIFKNIKKKDSKYLIISISPYTFISCILLRVFGKKPLVYLRSDGYGEYKVIFGILGPMIYHVMFSITSMISHLISCRKYILKGKKGEVISSSQLDGSWLNNSYNANFDKIKLLYIGRVKIEKGIYSLLEILKNNNELSLSIVGAEKDLTNKIYQSNVTVHEVESDKRKLIKFYDSHSIFVLPSFTEGHPMVLLEALARKRPVIIFEDIEHVIGEKKGIFVSKRNSINFFQTVDYIKKNYLRIKEEMSQNQLPTNKDFILELNKILNK
jgi:glycosyltransferase involved in cell wall biosynthesis